MTNVLSMDPGDHFRRLMESGLCAAAAGRTLCCQARDDPATGAGRCAMASLWSPRSPDLNPIEMAFSKVKAHLRRIGARTFDQFIKAIGEICDLFTPDE